MRNLYKDLMKTRILAATTVVSAMALPAQAADKELLDILLGNNAITQAQYDELLAKDEITTADAEDIVVDYGAGSGINISTRDGKYEFEMGGRLHLDYAQHDHDSRIGITPVNGFTTRRSRLELDGVFAGNWGWAAEVDFAENVVELKDFKIGYEGRNFSLYAGNQKQPYSLSLEMSSNDIPWLERSIDNYMVAEMTDRATGVRLETNGEHWFFAGGVFGEEPDSGTQGDEFWAASGRFIYAPVIEDNMVLHLGIRGAFRNTTDVTEFRVRDRTTDFSGLRIVDSGLLTDVDTVTMVGPEIGVTMGPLTILGEYSAMEVDRALDPDLDFNAWHLGAALSLTGDSRASVYRIDAGEFKGARAVQPFDPANGQWGGLELQARYASIDLNDGTFVGGTEDVLSAGLNWYPNPNIRFLFDWSHILDTDESNTVRLYAPGMNVYTVRAQFNY